MDQHRCTTGDHIVRVDFADRQVAHPVEAGPDLDRNHELTGSTVRVLELLATHQIIGFTHARFDADQKG